MSKVGNVVTYWLEIASLTPIPAVVIADLDEDGLNLLLLPYVDEYEVWQDRDIRYSVAPSATPAAGSYTIPDPM